MKMGILDKLLKDLIMGQVKSSPTGKKEKVWEELIIEDEDYKISRVHNNKGIKIYIARDHSNNEGYGSLTHLAVQSLERNKSYGHQRNTV